jgi:hypothetical protein
VVLGLSRTWLLVAVSLMVLTWSPGTAVADTSVHARMLSVNHTGAHGTATLTAHDDGSLTVAIRTRGLLPGQPHAQHIHGTLTKMSFMCPTTADDTDGDGLLTNEEATGEYGNIFLALTTRGDTSGKSGLALDRMPVADAHGRVDYHRTFAEADLPSGLLDHLSALHVVQHGIDVNHNGKYDVAGAGVSTFAENLGAPGVPEEATDPASCGMVVGAGAPVSPQGGVDTGRGPARGVDRGLAVGGAGLLAASLVLVALGVRQRRLSRRVPATTPDRASLG